MKAGSVILVLIVALVILGFLVSDDIQAHQKLQDALNQISQSQSELDQLRKQLSQATGDIQSLQARIAELKGQLAALQNVQASVCIPAIDPSLTDKLILSAGMFLIPGLLVGIPFTIKKFRQSKTLVRLTDAELQQLIRQRRTKRG
jgi:hypothetical protein